MGINSQEELMRAAAQFLVNNYDYVWLDTMLKKAHTVRSGGATLIIGSSLALNGVQESQWNNAVNCSMHSMDLYYAFLCARKVITSQEIGRRFARCFIIIAYYNAYSDLSRSTIYREQWIPRIYYPIFQDAHQWNNPTEYDLWSCLPSPPPRVKDACRTIAGQEILKRGTYYNDIRQRGSIFDLKGKKWWEITDDERLSLGIMRANAHNKGFQRYSESAMENREIIKEFVHFLHTYQIMPIVVVPPFTPVYQQYMRREIKENLHQMLDAIPEDIHYVDFNDCNLFEPLDFVDTDHLSESGAHKMSAILSDMFGK